MTYSIIGILASIILLISDTGIGMSEEFLPHRRGERKRKRNDLYRHRDAG